MQFILVEWFCEISVCPGFQSLDTFLFRDFCCDDYDGNMVDDVIASHLPAHFQTVYARHHEVGNDEVGHHLLCLVESLLAIGGIAYGISVGKLRSDIGCDVAIILDDEQTAFVISVVTVSKHR